MNAGKVKLIILGVGLLASAIILFRITWTFRSDLTVISGVLSNAGAEVNNVQRQSRYSTRESRVASLNFYLTGKPYRFALSEDIGDDWQYGDYEHMLKALKHADSMKVWIRKDDIDKESPRVYQLETERFTLLDFKDVKAEQTPFAVLNLIAGLVCFGLAIFLKPIKKA